MRDDMNILWAQVDEVGITLYTMGEIYPNIIDIPYPMWDAILVHIDNQRKEVEKEVADIKKTEGMKTPRLDEINWKDFPR